MAFLFDRNILEIDSNPKHDIKPLKFQRRIRENLQAKLLAKCNFRKIRKKNTHTQCLREFRSRRLLSRMELPKNTIRYLKLPLISPGLIHLCKGFKDGLSERVYNRT